MKTQFALLTVLALLLMPATLKADFVVGGSLTSVAAPADTTNGAVESDTTMFLFAEQTNVVLGSDVAVDITVPGSYVQPTDLTPGFVSAGTAVDSYFVHLDRVGTVGLLRLQGDVTFDREILGVMVGSTTLLASDGTLGALGTTYSGSTLRDLEQPQDRVFWTGNTLSFDFGTSNHVDQIRVLTAAVPEPTTMLPLLMGAAFCLRRRKNA